MKKERKLARITCLQLPEAAPFPNAALPVLLYQGVFPDGKPGFESLFVRHQWSGMWVNGVYTFHHFHATAHEALGCLSGWADLLLGGPTGSLVRLAQGDAVLIPAGVAHQLVQASRDFSVLGAYPPGQSPDLQRGDREAYPRLKEMAARVPLPETDPVMGTQGGIYPHWHERRNKGKETT